MALNPQLLHWEIGSNGQLPPVHVNKFGLTYETVMLIPEASIAHYNKQGFGLKVMTIFKAAVMSLHIPSGVLWLFMILVGNYGSKIQKTQEQKPFRWRHPHIFCPTLSFNSETVPLNISTNLISSLFIYSNTPPPFILSPYSLMFSFKLV